MIFFQLNNMTLAVGYPSRLLDLAVVNAYYKDYTIFIKDFFQNLQVFGSHIFGRLRKNMKLYL